MTVSALGALANARDLAGAARGLRPGIVWRSDAPLAGDADPAGLRPWPPATVVDLRDRSESRGWHALGEVSTVRSLPVLADADLAAPGPGLSLVELYRTMIAGEPGRVLARVVEAVAAEPGPILVHCSAGKDRTGVAMALVLRLLEVSREQVIADYAATAPNMERVVARMAAAWRSDGHGIDTSQLPPEALDAPRAAIELVLDAWDAVDDGARGWFRQAGGDDGAVTALRARLLV